MSQRIAEVILNVFWAALVVAKLERKGFLPRKLGGETASETARVATTLACFSLNPLFLRERHVEKAGHVFMSVRYKLLADAVIDHEEETVLVTGVGDEPGSI